MLEGDNTSIQKVHGLSEGELQKIKAFLQGQSTVGAPYVRVIGFALEILLEELIRTGKVIR